KLAALTIRLAAVPRAPHDVDAVRRVDLRDQTQVAVRLPRDRIVEHPRRQLPHAGHEARIARLARQPAECLSNLVPIGGSGFPTPHAPAVAQLDLDRSEWNRLTHSCLRGSILGAAPVGRATRRCCPGRNASWMLADGTRTVKGGAPSSIAARAVVGAQASARSTPLAHEGAFA